MDTNQERGLFWSSVPSPPYGQCELVDRAARVAMLLALSPAQGRGEGDRTQQILYFWPHS